MAVRDDDFNATHQVNPDHPPDFRAIRNNTYFICQMTSRPEGAQQR
jgi:hypothetical protein